MAYQALYRRYRPGRFGDVSGQKHVMTALRNAVSHGRVGHAYLFSGPRGTGKTTSARILAKALNCTNLTDGEPCCECASCQSFEAGTSYDLRELDAASNNGVDAMRDLISKVGLSAGGHGVFILDEVHMLSTGAENALLKTLEEPPPNVTFILATTEPNKVVPTIRSRTQHFDFTLLPADELEALVREIAADAELPINDNDVAYVVRAGKGSARDTLSALDQVVAAGGAPEDLDHTSVLIDALAARDTGTALVAVNNATQAGREPELVARALLADLRNAFLAAMRANLGHLSEADRAAAEQRSTQFGAASITRALDVLGTAIVDMRQAPDPRVDLELAVVRLTRTDLDTDPAALIARIERLEQGAPPVAAQAPVAAVAAMPDAAPPAAPPVEQAPPVQSAPPMHEAPVHEQPAYDASPVQAAPPAQEPPGQAAPPAQEPPMQAAPAAAPTQAAAPAPAQQPSGGPRPADLARQTLRNLQDPRSAAPAAARQQAVPEVPGAASKPTLGSMRRAAGDQAPPAENLAEYSTPPADYDQSQPAPQPVQHQAPAQPQQPPAAPPVEQQAPPVQPPQGDYAPQADFAAPPVEQQASPAQAPQADYAPQADFAAPPVEQQAPPAQAPQADYAPQADFAAPPGEQQAPPAQAPQPQAAPVAQAAPASVGGGITQEQAQAAWSGGILGALPGRVKSRFSAGEFLASDGDSLVFGLPNDVHRQRCEDVRTDVDAALAAHFGAAVPLKLVVGGNDDYGSSGIAEDQRPEHEDAIDINDLTDAPSAGSSVEERLTEAFPGSEFVEKPAEE